MVAVASRSCSLQIEKLATPMLLTSPSDTSPSIAAHVSFVGGVKVGPFLPVTGCVHPLSAPPGAQRLGWPPRQRLVIAFGGRRFARTA
jgi:hypothetical protein